MSDECPFSTGPGSRIGATDTDLSVSIPESCMNRHDCRIRLNVPGEYGEVRGLRFYRNDLRFRVSVGEVYRCHADVSPGIDDCFRRERQVKGIFPPSRISAYVDGSVVRNRRCTGFRMPRGCPVISLGRPKRRHEDIAKTPRSPKFL